ncbi:MAG: hypothetical protein H8E62_07605 [Planctomycetes bacterium]|nr:hypothetical protein [Planctomycetota bacterium]
MRRYVTCRVVDTVPTTAPDRERPTTSKFAEVKRSSPRQPREPKPRTPGVDPRVAMVKPLGDEAYAHHPFPAGEFLNIAI